MVWGTRARPLGAPRSGSQAMNVTILGAGPAGLAAADALAGRGAGVTVFERSASVGGMCRPVERNGYRFDLASDVPQ